MSQTTRRPKFFKTGLAHYPAFIGWNATLVDDGKGMLVRLVSMSEDEMATMATLPEATRYLRGVPTMICLHPTKRTVEVYPIPSEDFDAVTETKSWSAP